MSSSKFATARESCGLKCKTTIHIREARGLRHEHVELAPAGPCLPGARQHGGGRGDAIADCRSESSSRRKLAHELVRHPAQSTVDDDRLVGGKGCMTERRGRRHHIDIGEAKGTELERGEFGE